MFATKNLIICTLILLIFSENSFSSSDTNRINSLYEEGLLTRSECIKAKKKILGKNSNPDCRKISTINKELNKYSSQGSAFFISSQAHLITNDHVISKCDDNVKIKFKTKDYNARIIARDKFLDLAMLQANNIGRTSHLELSTDAPEKLQRVIAVGYPFGKYVSDDLKFTSGIISSIKGPGDDTTRIQIDASLNPGNSGGPIVDEKTGEVVAVSVARLDPSMSEGTNFAIKSSSLKNFLVANSMKPSTSLMSFSKSRSALLKDLENSTVFIYCE